MGEAPRDSSTWGELENLEGLEGTEETLFHGEERALGEGNGLLEMPLQLTALEIFKENLCRSTARRGRGY